MGWIQKKINQVLVQKVFEVFKGRAARLLVRPEASQAAVRQAEVKAARTLGRVSRLREDVRLLAGVTRDWVRGEYQAVPVGSMVLILGALLYFVSPVDALSDLLPVLGYVDDAFILTLVLGQVRADLEKYRFWREHVAR